MSGTKNNRSQALFLCLEMTTGIFNYSCFSTSHVSLRLEVSKDEWEAGNKEKNLFCHFPKVANVYFCFPQCSRRKCIFIHHHT